MNPIRPITAPDYQEVLEVFGREAALRVMREENEEDEDADS